MLKKFGLFRKPVLILLRANSSNITKVFKETGITYSYTSHILHRIMEENKLVTITREGRKMNTELTDKGKRIKQHLINIIEILLEDRKNVKKRIY